MILKYAWSLEMEKTAKNAAVSGSAQTCPGPSAIAGFRAKLGWLLGPLDWLGNRCP